MRKLLSCLQVEARLLPALPLMMPTRLHVFPLALCWLSLLLGVIDAGAQTTEFERVVPSADASVRDLPNYLVQQAWLNDPLRRELEAKVSAEDARILLARRGWIDQVNFNLNFSSIRDTLNLFGVSQFGRNNDRYLAPGLNYGVSFNLGGFLNNKRRVAVAKAVREIAVTQLDGPKPELRLAVLTALQEAENARELLRLRRRAEVDAETNYTLVRSLYDQGKAQFEDLAQASEVYFRAVESTAVAKNNQINTQHELEVLTGLDYVGIEEARRRYGK